MSFSDRLRAAQSRADSWLCVGLDTAVDRVPLDLRGRDDSVVAFNRGIIQATQDAVCAYKPNLAFYLAQGALGLDALLQTVRSVPRDIPIVLDAKFGDIESSAREYARFAFEVLQVDAVTVNPYLGADAFAPYLDYDDRALFILSHTSNPGACLFQEAVVGAEPLYLHVARFALSLSGKADIGLVVGATFPEQLQAARQANPTAPFLIPGLGAQGGTLNKAVQFGINAGGVGPLINASRAVLYASGGNDWRENARRAALQLRDEIRREIAWEKSNSP